MTDPRHAYQAGRRRGPCFIIAPHEPTQPGPSFQGVLVERSNSKWDAQEATERVVVDVTDLILFDPPGQSYEDAMLDYALNCEPVDWTRASYWRSRKSFLEEPTPGPWMPET